MKKNILFIVVLIALVSLCLVLASCDNDSSDPTPVSVTYTVTFDLNGIIGTAPPAQTIEKDGNVTKPADPTDTIHTFAGWYKTKDVTTGALSDKWDFDNGTVTADMTLYAQWTKSMQNLLGNDFPKSTGETVSAPENAWTNENGYKAYTYNSDKVFKLDPGNGKDVACLTSNQFTRISDGKYVFKYVNGSTNYGVFTLIEDSTLVSIEYDGTGTTYEELSGTYSAPAAPTEYIVTFDLNGIIGTAPPAQTIEKDGNVTKPADPTDTIHTFAGWYKTKDVTTGALSDKWDFDNGTVTADMTLYAQWTANTDTAYKVKHHQQDVTGSGYTLKETETLFGSTGEMTSAAAKTYEGFTAQAFDQQKIAADGSTVVKIYYDRNTYTVTFNANSHGTAPADRTGVRYEATIDAPTAPTATGYTFGGWYKEAACENEWKFDTDTVTKYTTLYAKWTENTATLTYNANGHGTAPSAVTMKYTAETKAAAALSATGYTFNGWNTEADGGGTDYAAGAVVKAANVDPTAITLYAKWVPKGFVDLGVKTSAGKPLYWATCNLGASNPQDPGDYYMWGATALMYSAVDYTKTEGAFTFVKANPYDDSYKNTWNVDLGFDWNNVPFADGIFNSTSNKNVFTKYTTSGEYAKSGTKDDITTLQAKDDVATAKNASWRMPTYDELVALRNNCVLVWTSDYNNTGNAGYIVYKAKNEADKGKVNIGGTWKMWDAANSKYITNTGSEPTGYSTFDIHIFLPAAGYGNNTTLGSKNIAGCYCSSDLNNTNNNSVGAVNFTKSTFNIAYNYFRSYGFSIRPVTE